MKLLLLLIVCLVLGDDVTPETVKTVDPILLIKGGIVVNLDGEVKKDVLIKDGKVAKIESDIKVDPSYVVIDATGKYVMPGGIDPHVHMELPFMGTVSRDDFFTGTSAALAGGTTMIIDFAIPKRNQSLIDIYDIYREKAKKSASDYALHMGISEWNDRVSKEMDELVTKRRVVNSFKGFTAYRGVYMLSDEEWFNAMKKCKEVGAVAMVHAENGIMVEQGQKNMIENGVLGPEGHPMSRPSFTESEAVKRVATLAHLAGVPLYVVHVMSHEAMDEIAFAKKNGWRIVGEPILAGLVLDGEGYWHHDWEHAAKLVMSPPIRRGDREHLKNGLKARILDLVGTDHCVFSMEQKRMGRKDFTKIPNGVHGVEDRMGLVWDRMVDTGKITPSDFVRITSAEAAQIFNIFPQKGAVREGSDADIIVLDPKKEKIISAKTHHQNIEYSNFEGWTQRGVVDVTVSRGRVVWSDGKLNVVRGAGRFVPTPPFGKLFDGIDREDAARKPVPVKRN